MTKIEIIQETAKFYNATNRAEDRGTCFYTTGDGNCCAVGRCMTQDALSKYGHFRGDVYDLLSENAIGSDNIDSILKDEYQGHDETFWRELQIFHDSGFNFTDEGLSIQGQEALNQLLSDYKDQ